MAWNGWSLYWLLWILVGFAVPEVIAMLTGHHNTLSSQVWHLEGTFGLGFRIVVGLFCVWLAVHLTLGWFR